VCEANKTLYLINIYSQIIFSAIAGKGRQPVVVRSVGKHITVLQIIRAM